MLLLKMHFFFRFTVTNANALALFLYNEIAEYAESR